MSVREDRIKAADELDVLSKAAGRATALAGRGLISVDLANKMGQFALELAKVSADLTQTHSGVVVRLGKPNRRAPQAKPA